MPWEHWWVWQLPAEREHYSDALRRVQRSPLLRDAVVFDDAGPDVAAWLRRVGFVLSTSDDESFHVAPAEGMASGAVPVIRHWPGAETIYDPRWISENPAEMAASIAALASPDDLARRPGRTRTSRRGRSSSARSAAAWLRLHHAADLAAGRGTGLRGPPVMAPRFPADAARCSSRSRSAPPRQKRARR